MKISRWMLGLALCAVTAAAQAQLSEDTITDAIKNVKKGSAQIGVQAQSAKASSGRRCQKKICELDPGYDAYCVMGPGGNSVSGYVLNRSKADLMVSGTVRFIFYQDDIYQMTNKKEVTQPMVGVPVPAGSKATHIVTTPLPFVLEDGTKCRFEVKEAIK